MIRFSIGAQRLASGLIAGAVLLSLAASPSHAAAKIQRLISPGGIEAWFVQDATVPLIAIDRKSTRLNSSHVSESRMPSSA